jgi:hypothetical protein
MCVAEEYPRFPPPVGFTGADSPITTLKLRHCAIATTGLLSYITCQNIPCGHITIFYNRSKSVNVLAKRWHRLQENTIYWVSASTIRSYSKATVTNSDIREDCSYCLRAVQPSVPSRHVFATRPDWCWRKPKTALAGDNGQAPPKNAVAVLQRSS